MLARHRQMTIKRLRVKAPGRRGESIAADLRDGGWPVRDYNRWIFIRRIAVAAHPARLRFQAALAINHLAAKAVDGRTGAARNAEAVYFKTLPQLLAFLLRDLIRGELAATWYWRRWSHLLDDTPARGISELLWEHAAILPAVIEELHEINELAHVWRRLSPTGAQQIIRRLPVSTVTPNRAGSDARQLDENEEIYQAAKKVFARRINAIECWKSILADLDSEDPRIRLAAIASGLQYCPLLINRDCPAVIRAFCSLPAALPDTVPRPSPVRSFSEIANKDARDETAEPMLNTKQAATGTKSSLSRALLPERKTALAHTNNNQVASPELPPSPGQGQAREETEQPLGWSTDSGGIFYLINAMNNPECLEILLKRQHPVHPNGWLWLFSLAGHMGGELDNTMLEFLAGECDCPDVETLLKTAPVAGLDELAFLLDSRYRDSDFWNQSLLATPARVNTDPSHIDVFFPLSSVRLSVRLAALDVNPGWVPWLGRVVTFYYREETRKWQ